MRVLRPEATGPAPVGEPAVRTLAPGEEDAWLARVDEAGNTLWIAQVGSDLFDSATRVESDGAGGALVCGATLGAVGGPPAGPMEAWYARFDGAGNALWQRQFGSLSGSGNTLATGLARDGAGGFHEFKWDGTGNTLRALPAGTYLVNVKAVKPGGGVASVVKPVVIAAKFR